MASFNILGLCQNLVLPSLSRAPVALTSQRFIRKSVLQKLDLPAPPKRPANAYAQFLKFQLPELKKKHPDSKQSELFKKATSLWKTTDESLKNKLKERSESEIVKYRDELKAYKEQLKPHEEAILKEEAKEINKENRKELAKLGKPKRPASAFAQFVKAHQDKRGNLSVAEYMQVLAVKWRSLSENEKAQYELESQKRKKQYEKELEVWKSQIVLAFPDVIKETKPSKPAKQSAKKDGKSKKKSQQE